MKITLKMLAILFVMLTAISVYGHVLDCDFSTNACSWSSLHGQGEDAWTLQPPTEDTDGYLFYKPSWGAEDGTKVTSLQSPMVETPPSSVFYFSYWMVIGGQGALRVRLRSYFKNGTFAEESTIFERRKTSMGHRQASIPISDNDGYFRLLVDAVHGRGFYGVMQADDFRFEVSCDENYCQNGGTCVKLAEDKLECQCAPGYDGKECEKYAFHQSICSGIDMKVSSWPESFTRALVDQFGVKCLVYKDLLPENENAACHRGGAARNGGAVNSFFRAITSVVIMKENVTTGDKTPIAMVSAYDGPVNYLGEEVVEVFGKVSQVVQGSQASQDTDSEVAYLNVDWLDPDKSAAGVYMCRVVGLDTLGQSVGGEARVETILRPDTVNGLLSKVEQLKAELQALKLENERIKIALNAQSNTPRSDSPVKESTDL